MKINKKNVETINRKSLLYRTGVEYGDFCINHVEGCSHGCRYPCYAMMMKKRAGVISSYEDWRRPKIVSNALELLEKEIPRYQDKIKSVHLCFATDPFMFKQEAVGELSVKIIRRLNNNDIPCTVLTKGIYPNLKDFNGFNEYGITLVSLDEKFREKYEPNTAPFEERIEALKVLHRRKLKTWVSIEPYPTPNIIKQDLKKILEAIAFVDKIVFGRLNYNPEARNFLNAKIFYNCQAKTVIDFCKKKGIGYYIKEGTLTS